MQSFPSIAHQLPAVHSAISVLRQCNFEHCILVVLNKNKQVISQTTLSSASSSQLVINPRILLHGLMPTTACYCLLLHNHPSGKSFPSHADLQTTERLIHIMQLLNVSMLDHLIVTQADYFSFEEAGLLNQSKACTLKPISQVVQR